MKNIYLVKKNTEMEVSNENWIVMNAYEFAMFLKTPDGERRKDNFGKLPNSGADADYTIYAECGVETAKEWKSEQNSYDYLLRSQKESGIKTIPYQALIIDGEEKSGEEVIADENENVELYVLKKMTLEELRKAISLLSEYEKELILCLFLLEKPMSAKNFADMKGTDPRNIINHKHKVLLKLKKMLET